METKGFFKFEIIINVLVSSFSFLWIRIYYFIRLGLLCILNSFSVGSQGLNIHSTIASFKWLKITNIWLNITEMGWFHHRYHIESQQLECEIGLSHHTPRSESQHHECEMGLSHHTNHSGNRQPAFMSASLADHECEMGWSHQTSRSESQHHECEMGWFHHSYYIHITPYVSQWKRTAWVRNGLISSYVT